MKPVREVLFRAVPLVEKFGGKPSNDPLVRCDAAVRKEGRVEGVERWGAIQHESGLREMAAGFPEKSAIQCLAGEKVTEVLAEAAMQ